MQQPSQWESLDPRTACACTLGAPPPRTPMAAMALASGRLACGLGGSTRLLQRRLGAARRLSSRQVVQAVSEEAKAKIQERLPGE